MLTTPTFKGGNNQKVSPFLIFHIKKQYFIHTQKTDTIEVPGDIGIQREKRHVCQNKAAEAKDVCVVSVCQSVTFSKRSPLTPHGALSVTNTTALSFTGDS